MSAVSVHVAPRLADGGIGREGESECYLTSAKEAFRAAEVDLGEREPRQACHERC